MIHENDAASGQVIERELTDDEIAQRKADELAYQTAQEARLAEEALKAAKKAELLAKLGITEDDAKLLLS